jgi:hypothetical protein
MRGPDIDPDWLRVGTDIIGAPETFNGTFSLSGIVTTTPEPSMLVLLGSGLLLIGIATLRQRASD